MYNAWYYEIIFEMAAWILIWRHAMMERDFGFPTKLIPEARAPAYARALWKATVLIKAA